MILLRRHGTLGRHFQEGSREPEESGDGYYDVYARIVVDVAFIF